MSSSSKNYTSLGPSATTFIEEGSKRRPELDPHNAKANQANKRNRLVKGSVFRESKRERDTETQRCGMLKNIRWFVSSHDFY